MATVTRGVRQAQSVPDRLAESLDSTFVQGMIIGLAGLLGGYLLTWLGGRYDRPHVAAVGAVLEFVGGFLVALMLIRWLFYVTSPRMAMLLDREVAAYFLSPIAYLVLIGMLVITMINFWYLVAELRDVRTEIAGETSPVTAFVAYNLWFWLGMLFVIPVITMRLLSEEKRSGTIEVLMTAPITETQVVLGKYFASLLFYALTLVPTAAFLVVLRSFGKFEFELAPVVAMYLGALTIGAMFLSFGIFFSSLTRNQIIAAMLTFAVLMILFSTFVLDMFSARLGAWAPVVKYIAVLPHLGELGKGKMDVKYLLFHVSVAVFMIYATVKVVEARKWK